MLTEKLLVLLCYHELDLCYCSASIQSGTKGFDREVEAIGCEPWVICDHVNTANRKPNADNDQLNAPEMLEAA